MQEKTNIQTSTLRVPKSILEEIKIYCRKAGKPVGEWVETAWKFIEKNDFDIYDKETTPFLPVPPDIEKESVKIFENDYHALQSAQIFLQIFCFRTF